MTAKKVLKDYFGHDEFIEGQEGIIDAILAGRDAVGIMPTGGGKSVCYQVPAMIFKGITIVISPLISLMKDQIHGLTQSGVSAAYINSTLSESQVDRVLQNAREAKYKIIYIAPERLMSARFLEFCYGAEIPFVAVDEAHCVSQWGQDFRPSYSSIPAFISKFKNRPVVAAFTATATERVRQDIVRLLNLENPRITINSFDRKNLYFDVKQPKRRYAALYTILSDKKEQFGIVYCSTRKTVEEVCLKLQNDGFSAGRYHAGLSDSERHKVQDDFIFDRINIIVATNAFGMGIDKSNVSFVVHYNMPKDIESYYQEAGRAGRDGNRAECILLYNGQDLRTNLFLIENSEGRYYESEEQKSLLQSKERERLKAIEIYCNTSSCLRKYILSYFGESVSKNCENCGSCLQPTEEIDITVLAQKILSCVVRTNELYGRNIIIDVLRGSKTDKVLRAGLTNLSTYGICGETEDELKETIGFLAENEYLCYTNGQYPVLKLGKYATKILKDKTPLFMRRAIKQEISSENSRHGKTRTFKYSNADNVLLSRLKTLRRKIADEQRIPAYVIFHDSTLIEMSERLPVSPVQFSEISGVGKRKLDSYGEIFIEAIKDYMAENNITSNWISSNTADLYDNLNANGASNTAYGSLNADYDGLNTDEIEISDEPVQIRDFTSHLNSLLERFNIKKLTPQTVNDWLTEAGILESPRDGKGKLQRNLTALGKEYGMTQEKRSNTDGVEYNVILYPKKIQLFIKENLKEILVFRYNQKTNNVT